MIGFATLCIACGGGGGEDSSDSAAADIGSQGGVVRVGSGAEVVIPPGALDRTVTITIESVASFISPTGIAALHSAIENGWYTPAFLPFGGAVRLGPPGLTFSVPVEVTIPGGPGPERDLTQFVGVAQRDDQSGEITLHIDNVLVEADLDQVTAFVTSFSSFEIVGSRQVDTSPNISGKWKIRAADNRSDPPGAELPDLTQTVDLDHQNGYVRFDFAGVPRLGARLGSALRSVETVADSMGTRRETLQLELATPSGLVGFGRGTLAWIGIVEPWVGGALVMAVQNVPPAFDIDGQWSLRTVWLDTQEIVESTINITQFGDTFVWGNVAQTGLVADNQYVLYYRDGSERVTLSFQVFDSLGLRGQGSLGRQAEDGTPLRGAFIQLAPLN